MKIAATGLDGLVGTRIREVLGTSHEFVNLKEGVLDITDKEQSFEVIQNTDFDIFLHLAAFTNVDAAEEQRELAWKVNVEGTRNVYDAVSAKGKRFFYISTGFVFDGTQPPYFEDSTPNPISYYGLTKLEGEKIVQKNGTIIRIDYPYGSHVEYKKDIVESLIDVLTAKKPLKGIVDQIMTPTYIDDIALTLEKLFITAEQGNVETYHVVGSDSLSGMEIIQEIGKVFNLDTSHVAKTTYDEFYAGKAARPKRSIMKSHHANLHTNARFHEGLEKLKLRMQAV